MKKRPSKRMTRSLLRLKHVFYLKNREWRLEIGWHSGLQTYAAEIYNMKSGKWCQRHNQIIKELMKQVRWAIADIEDPRAREVRVRLGLEKPRKSPFIW